MARMTLEDFDAELLIRIGKRTDITAAQRAQKIHAAYQMVANEFPHPELQGKTGEVLLINTDNLTPTTADIWWPEHVKDISNNRFIDYTSIVKIEKNAKPTGVVTEYYWWGNVFYFNRSSSAQVNLIIWYKKKISELSSGESPVFERSFDDLIPMRAAQLCLDAAGDQKAAIIQERSYRSYVEAQRFPTYEHERNDRRKGIIVRTR